jgi:hypothetical protein
MDPSVPYSLQVGGYMQAIPTLHYHLTLARHKKLSISYLYLNSKRMVDLLVTVGTERKEYTLFNEYTTQRYSVMFGKSASTDHQHISKLP